MLPRRPPVFLGPGPPVNCSPGDLGPTRTVSSAQTCGLLSSCFSAFPQDQCEEESMCAVLAGSGGRGGDAGRRLRWVSPHPHPGGCLRWGRMEADLWGGVAWGLRWSPPLLCHPGAGRASWHTPFAVLSRSEVMAGSGVPEVKLGPGRSAHAEVCGADTLGLGDPARFPADGTPASDGSRLPACVLLHLARRSSWTGPAEQRACTQP